MGRIKNTMLIGFPVALALATLVFNACQNRENRGKGKQDKLNDEEIIKTYFLPDRDPETIKRSFKLCGTNNEKAVENVSNIAGAKSKVDLDKEINKLAEKFEGNCKDCEDPRQNDFVKKSSEWREKIENGSMTAEQLAYEYAFFQHYIYLKYPDKIPPGIIQDLYKMAKSDEMEGCLGKNAKIAQNDKPDKEPRNGKEKRENAASKEDGNSTGFDWPFKYLTCLGILVLLFLILDGRKGFKYINRAGPAIRKLIDKLKFPVDPEASFDDKYEKLHPKVPNQTSIKETVRTPVPELEITATREVKQEEQLQTKTSREEAPKKPSQLDPIPPKTPVSEPNSPKAAPAPLPKYPEPKITQPVAAIPQKSQSSGSDGPNRWYARMPSGNLFFNLSLQADYPDTPFVITLRGSEGTFDLVKDGPTLERLFSMTDQLKDACELLNINNPTLKTYEVKAPGKIVLAGEYWQITEKLKLDW